MVVTGMVGVARREVRREDASVRLLVNRSAPVAASVALPLVARRADTVADTVARRADTGSGFEAVYVGPG